jgi:hypothetical protein
MTSFFFEEIVSDMHFRNKQLRVIRIGKIVALGQGRSKPSRCGEHQRQLRLDWTSNGRRVPYFLSSGFTYFTVPPPFCEWR